MGKIGIKVLRYPSHNCKTKSFDLKSMIECLEGA
jgi:aspartate/tyrosine/aromatic aminotransferase